MSEVGNLFIVGFEGKELTKDIASKLLKLKPAGIILYDTNLDSKAQVSLLTSDLRELLGENLIITIDQEGGKVERLRKVARSLPSYCLLGHIAKVKKELIEFHSEILAYDLKAMGINFVFGPCLDLNTQFKNPIIGTRSLGKDPVRVSSYAESIIESYHKMGIACAAKHYPGHGDSVLDSHLDLPIIDYGHPDDNYQALKEYQKHLKPFKAAIESDVDAIMIAHAIYPCLSTFECKDLPASINKEIITVELATRLAYQNLIISDEITMSALDLFGDYTKLTKLLIKAGNNLIIWNTNLDEAIETNEAINQILYEDPELGVKLDQSIEKVNEKAKLISQRFRQVNLNKDYELEYKTLEVNASAFIETNNRKFKLSGDTCNLIFEDRKLETDYITKSFNFNTYSLVHTNNQLIKKHFLDLLKELKYYQNILVFTFQIYNSPIVKQLVEIMKNNKELGQVIVIETDMPTKLADFNTFGANRFHYQIARKSFY
jgi:beta-glucosidase-like glycosyl hydrolase